MARLQTNKTSMMSIYKICSYVTMSFLVTLSSCRNDVMVIPMEDINTGGKTTKSEIVGMYLLSIKENLTIADKNADKFWTLYEKYISDEKAIHASFKKAMDSKGIKRETMREGKGTEEQAAFYLSQKMSFKDKMYQLDKKFYNEAKVLLTAKELYDFYHLEQSFKDQCTRRQQQAQAAKKQAPQPAPQKK